VGESARVSAVASAERVSIRRLHWRPVAARDRPAGELADVLFDDQSWAVRYLVIDTVDAMPRRDVLVTPAQVESLAPALRLRLTRDELKQCPDLDEDRPVYLQYDMRGVPRPADPHLRSAEMILGFAVRTAGSAAGRLKDVELDAERWQVATLIVDSGVWLPGKRREIAPREVRAIDWIARSIDLG
jgi:hypothetical protein